MATLSVWDETTIGELASVSRGASPRPIASPRWFDMNSVVRWVRIADMNRSDGRILRETTQALSPDGVARSRFLEPGTLIMSIAATVGVPVITGVPACIHDGFVALEDLKADKRFLLYLLKASEQRLREAGQSGSQMNVNTDIVRRLQVRIPVDRKEQAQIASALWDVDNLIASLERLIAKKRAIKQGMMQELLTGVRRLPGFTGSWGTLDVAAASHLKARIGWQGLTTAEYRPFGEFWLVGGTDFKDGRVNWSTTSYVDKWRFDQDSNIQLRQGDILLTKDGTIGKVAFVDSLPGPATLNSGVFVMRPKRGAYDSRFMYFLLCSRMFEEFVAGLSAGSTINHLYQRDLATLTFNAPADIDEQTAIATSLLDADREIAVLESRLQSTRGIKLGMMQELLTGRVRLPMEGDSA
ncbi:restriction endonuclease subunit S [Pseudarthrobacter oxydans]|uniref:restriction endonuclease subunit S n=1 Tax=Pseudarthrobacter oxydans TaxID=1671 RepID=UPI00382715F2